MTALVWRIKSSLLAYVRRMPDGLVEVSGGARETPDGFVFPALPGAELRFAGTVTLTGHDGMMRVVLADPALVESDGSWHLELTDPDDPTVRLPFATIEDFDGTTASGAALTADGADLFFGPYEEGTALDDPEVR